MSAGQSSAAAGVLLVLLGVWVLLQTLVGGLVDRVLALAGKGAASSSSSSSSSASPAAPGSSSAGASAGAPTSSVPIPKIPAGTVLA